MYHYYPIFGGFGPVFFPVQNPNPIATFSHFINYDFAQVQKNFKKEQSLQQVIVKQEIKVYQSKRQKMTIEPKIQTTGSLDEPEINDEIQSQSKKEENKYNRVKAIEKGKSRDNKKFNMEKKDKAYVAKQYPKQEPSISCRYIQKNFQLNIINQVFSFLWSEQKSLNYVRRFFEKNDIKATLYYQYIKVVRKFCKRYINKEYLKDLCDYQHRHIAYKMVSKNTQKLQYLSIGEFSQCVKHLIFIYLKQLCPQAVLTSKKMRREIWREHLIKCRLLRQYMFDNLSPQDYEKELIQKKAIPKKDQSKIFEQGS